MYIYVPQSANKIATPKIIATIVLTTPFVVLDFINDVNDLRLNNTISNKTISIVQKITAIIISNMSNALQTSIVYK